jgi:hypothetical protein
MMKGSISKEKRTNTGLQQKIRFHRFSTLNQQKTKEIQPWDFQIVERTNQKAANFLWMQPAPETLLKGSPRCSTQHQMSQAKAAISS